MSHACPDATRFGAALRAARRARGLSQREVAEVMSAAGFSWGQSTAAKAEAAERPVSIGEAAALAAALATSVAALLGEDTGPAAGPGMAAMARLVCARGRLSRAQADYAAAQAAYAAAHLPAGDARNGTENEAR